MSVAGSYLRKLEYNKYTETYKKWRAQYDVNYFKDAVNLRIIPFLQYNGYVLGIEIPRFIKRLEAYCWAHEWTVNYAPNKKISYGEQFHFGTEDDYDWFRETIDTVKWEKLFTVIQEPGLFDYSPGGTAQRMDFCKFAWLQMDINNSKAHKVFTRIMDNYADDDTEAPVDRVED